jgi:hypothetical protein
VRIVVLVHRHWSFDNVNYYMSRIAKLLRQEGVEVVVQRGPGEHVPADLAVLHVDLTVVPDEYMDFLSKYPRVINGTVRDISKRHVSRLQVTRGDGYAGPVIIKANLNCGGVVEANLAKAGKLPKSYLDSFVSNYPVLSSPTEVPADVWDNPNRVVERFQPEVNDGVYCLRMWKFLGDAETNTLAYSRDPVVKGRNTTHREEGGSVPDELRQLRKELGFDYGKFDYGMVDGKPVLYDANRTPTFSCPLEEEMPRLKAFARALKAMATESAGG